MCIPMLWTDVLVEIDPNVLPLSFTKVVFWARSRLLFVEPDISGEKYLPIQSFGFYHLLRKCHLHLDGSFLLALMRCHLLHLEEEEEEEEQDPLAVNYGEVPLPDLQS